ncbi:MAG: Tyrosine recombinase XerC [Candidatus Wolfebacteria bacterium GW2011_GWA2_42_10]|uniref:Tyrosine recombinase XerC n=2 Tax=Candidatus Wolfeibacteriota TaxID=1752735 RepID=A0A0G0XKA7_9BACT|nr:MAG: Tyrosine recombinase XerC [Candidatus Wolfebacteria bacterium GW2011_GWB1_41_12]KKS25334.1 MAG: Tyrosine recombinase XerC [Candidatus Wolfebacteria bacterium GW2011_GWA2_42_10]KKT56773.1 MAG: Tyrosine recombinase XerC [Candidatus Wolfebacteria bacterium GW2011_GWA1_44_24]
MDIKILLKNYLDYLEIEKNRSPKTAENYKRYLEAFLNFGGIKTEKGITLDKVRDFRLYLARRKTPRGENYKKTTQSYYVIALRNFLKFLTKNDYEVLSPDKIELPRTPSRQIKIIEYQDLERLLEAPKGSDLRSLRDKAILEILFSTGLRISELCSLNRYIDLARGELTVRGKGDKLRAVFLSERAKKAIDIYLKKRNDAEEALFVSLTKSKNPKIIGRIIPRTIQRIIDFYGRKAGVAEKVHPHMIRHSYATDLLINGADLRSVQELLGHANVSTTQIYTHLTNKELRETHRAFHGRRRR